MHQPSDYMWPRWPLPFILEVGGNCHPRSLISQFDTVCKLAGRQREVSRDRGPWESTFDKKKEVSHNLSSLFYIVFFKFL